MALASFSSPNGVVISVRVLVLSAAGATIFLFLLLSSLSSSPHPCTCSPTTLYTPTVEASATTVGASAEEPYKRDRISATFEDIQWLKSQIESNGLHMEENVLRKGINPRTRQQQLQDLIQYDLFTALFYTPACICTCFFMSLLQ